MNHFLYLVQSRARLVKNWLHLAERPNAAALFLTFDAPAKPAYFFPNCSFWEGRNKLCELALAEAEYQYYIFMDDDVQFERGGWDAFEQQLLALRPAVAYPVFRPKTYSNVIKPLKAQVGLVNDEQLLALHFQVLRDAVLQPLFTLKDQHSWTGCEMQEILIQHFYPYDNIQLNTITVTNLNETSYAPPEGNSYQFFIRDWLREQFAKPFKDTAFFAIKFLFHPRHFLLLLKTVLRTFRFYLRRRAAAQLDFSISEETLRRQLQPGSKLLKYILANREKARAKFPIEGK